MDTTATVRKESIEDQKAQLDARINEARDTRDRFYEDTDMWRAWDKTIDTLLAEKDALTACPSDWLEGDPEDRNADSCPRDVGATEHFTGIVAPEVYDFTPFPKEMPDINIDLIDPIPF